MIMKYISEKRLPYNHSGKVKNFPGSITEKMNEKKDVLLGSKPDMFIDYVDTNDCWYC